MGDVIEIDPSLRLRRTLAYFLEGCSIEERLEMLKLFEARAYDAGYLAGLTKARRVMTGETE